MIDLEIYIRRGRTILAQAWKALTLHRLRSFLSVLGIVFAVAAVVTMLAIAEGAKREVLDQIGRLGIDTIIVRNARVEDEAPVGPPDVRPDDLGFRDVDAMGRIPGVERIAFAGEDKTFLSELGRTEVVTTLAVDPDYLTVRGLRPSRGRLIAAVDVNNSQQVCVLGAELAGRLRPAAGPGSTIHLGGDPYRVVGVLQARGRVKNEVLPLTLRDFDNAAFVPLLESGGATDVGLSEIILKVTDPNRIQATAGAVRRALLRLRDGFENFELVVPRELLAQARQTQHLFNIVLGTIAGISLLVGGIGIMNIMLANVSERTREIGIRRAIGASRRHIIVHFLGESILLTVIGGIFGIFLGAFAALGVNLFIQWRASFTLWPVLSALLMSLAVGVLSGLYPAAKAADMEPVAALRHI